MDTISSRLKKRTIQLITSNIQKSLINLHTSKLKSIQTKINEIFIFILFPLTHHRFKMFATQRHSKLLTKLKALPR